MNWNVVTCKLGSHACAVLQGYRHQHELNCSQHVSSLKAMLFLVVTMWCPGYRAYIY